MSARGQIVASGGPLRVARKTSEEPADRAPEPIRAHQELPREILSGLRRGNQHLQFLKDVVRCSNVAIIGRRLDGTVVSWNPAARRVFGYAAKEMIGRSILTVVPPERHAQTRKIMAAIARGERLDQIEAAGMRKDGKRFPMIVTVSPVRNAEGKLVGASVILRDISQHKRTEALIRYERDRATHYLEIAQVIILVLDRRGRIVLLNRKGCRVFGCRQRELLHRDWFTACLPRRSRPAMRKMFRRLLSRKSARPEYHESSILTRPGKERLIAWRCSALTDADGQIVGTLSSGEDVTGRRAAEEALRRLSRRLLQVRDEERRRIARELHDSTAQRLSLLITQLGRAERLGWQGQAKTARLLHEARAMAGQVLKEVRSLAYLLHPPLLEEMGLASALRIYVAELRKRQGTRIHLEIPSRLDRFPRSVELSAFRIVQEALANALRHSRSSGVRIRLLRLGRSLVVKVIDHGRGLNARPAAQPGFARRRSGMGMASMRERATLVGGRLEIRSGKSGTTVTAVIPVTRKAREEDTHTFR